MAPLAVDHPMVCTDQPQVHTLELLHLDCDLAHELLERPGMGVEGDPHTPTHPPQGSQFTWGRPLSALHKSTKSRSSVTARSSPIGRLAPLRSIDIDVDIDTARLIALIDGSEIGAALTAAFSAR